MSRSMLRCTLVIEILYLCFGLTLSLKTKCMYVGDEQSSIQFITQGDKTV